MLTITKEKIKEIADLLDCGMKCFFNKKDGEIEYFPDSGSHEYMDPDQWEEIIEKIDENFDDYIPFIPMESRDSFRVMEDFIKEVEDKEFHKRLIWALNRRSPFRNFKDEIDYNGDYRERWFAFKLEKNIAWVKEQLSEYNNRI